MTLKNTSTSLNSIQNDLLAIKKNIYDKCGFDFSNYKKENQSQEYGACTFELNGIKIKHRVSKITPTKTGQFVTIWKRNKDGITEPFEISDEIDFIVIASKSGDKFGQFIFPKSVLADKGIITKNGKVGKRGIRVYPPWDSATNKQAQKSQSWQTDYFLTIKNDNSTDLDLAKKLFSQTKKTLRKIGLQ